MTTPLTPGAPGAIRESLETIYAATMDRSLLDDVKVMASEMTSNAVQHSSCRAGDELSMSVDVTNGILHVEVGDAGHGAAALEPRSLEPPSGLGYLEILSDRWSSRQNALFRVWFEIDVVSRTLLARASPV